MPVRGARRRFVSLATVLLVAGAHAARAEEQIYKWMDEKGQIHFTATPPPPGARQIGAKPQPKQPVQIVPMPGTSQRSSAPGVTRTTPAPRKPLRTIPPRSESHGSESSDCGQHSDAILRLKNAQRNVDSLRAALDRIGDDPVVSSRTSCTTRGERLDACRGGSYNREHELERTREKLQQAQDELADAEGELRAAGVSPDCVRE